MNLQKKIKEVRSSIVGIGFFPGPNQVSILGTGFCVSDDGKIITAAHLLQNLTAEQISGLMANVIIEQRENGIERYQWIPITLINKNDRNDLAYFQLGDEYKKTLLKKLELEDSNKAEVGQDVYFIGFPYAAQLMNDGFGITLVVNKGMISNIKIDGTDPELKRNWLIVDAISNPGNSGCPLIDLETNKVIGVMTISFRTASQKVKDLDIREPMHIAGAKPANLIRELTK